MIPNRRRIVGRLAPSPTGAQHVGNARTYVIAWLSARAQKGRVLLRYTHPLQFLPYQYEVYDAAGRAVLQAADISMRLIDTHESGETPP